MLPLYMIFYFVVGLHFVNNYSGLPATIPVHFNEYGEPDGWISKEKFGWMHWGFIFCMTGIFAVAANIVKKMPPAKLNIPNKDYWLAPERAKETMEWITDSLTWMGIAGGGIIFLIDHYIMKAAMIGNRSADLSAVSSVLAWGGLLIVLIMLRLMVKLRRPPQS